MDKNETDGDIALWIPKFILMRNTRSLSSFPNLLPKLKLFTADQYAIGWREFMEGHIAKSLFNVQEVHLNEDAGTMAFKRWTKGFTTQLLHITQSQWIHQNSSLHQREHGYLDQQLKKKLAKDVVRYLDTDPQEIPPESRFLLKINPEEILDSWMAKNETDGDITF